MAVTLDDILERTRRNVSALRPRAAEVEAAAWAAPAPPNWTEAFTGEDVAIIAEVKRRSPSAGVIAPNLDPAGHARAYVAGGARAVSVLTDAPHFGGTLEDLETVRRSVSVPTLRKDFVLDPVQVFESRAAGASAVLLIVRALDAGRLHELAALAAELGLGRLVEVHDLRELEVALSVAPETVGVNSRDLDTFTVSVDGMREVLRAIPPDLLAVAESGLGARGDVAQVAEWGADAALVGTALARSRDPRDAVARLTGVPRNRRG